MLEDREVTWALVGPGVLLAAALLLAWSAWRSDRSWFAAHRGAGAAFSLAGARSARCWRTALLPLACAVALVMGQYGAFRELAMDPLVEHGWRWMFPVVVGGLLAAWGVGRGVLERSASAPKRERAEPGLALRVLWGALGFFGRFGIGFGAVLGTVWEITTLEWGAWTHSEAVGVAVVGGALVAFWWWGIDTLAAPGRARAGFQDDGVAIGASGVALATLGLAAGALVVGAASKSGGLYVGVGAIVAALTFGLGLLRRRVTIAGGSAGVVAVALGVGVSGGLAYEYGEFSRPPEAEGWVGPWLWWLPIFLAPAAALIVKLPGLRVLPGWVRVLLVVLISGSLAGLTTGVALSISDTSAY